ncbi:response regulator [Massilia horti]|uniref:Response regulator transcription factor n=1 Tax=Massilia horti TaxID=2562153 RepID=A0A4Y9T452_9BURK|nr:response regulator transcription factor [Massilia horti]TFW32345.1 response regulator transcription factor [Massilia horti]
MIRIVIADDHELIRLGVKKIVRSHPDVRIVGEAANLASALALVGQHAPDVVVLDINLPDYDGLEGLAALLHRFPQQRVVLLSTYDEDKYAVRALRAGAGGYVTKSMAAEELMRAVRQVAAGETYIGPRLAEQMARRMLGGGEPLAHERLTARENEILELIGAGLQIKQVAAELGISVSSVNTYRNRIFGKLGLNSNAALIRYALKNGLVA